MFKKIQLKNRSHDQTQVVGYSQKNWVECSPLPKILALFKTQYQRRIWSPTCNCTNSKTYSFNRQRCKRLYCSNFYSPSSVSARGGTPLYKLYRYVLPQRVWFLSCFGLKTGIDFDHYGLKSGVVFKGTTGAYKCICLFNSK